MKLPQFSLRDLLWLVLVAGLALAWWLSMQRADEDRRQLAAELAALRRAKALEDAQRKWMGIGRPYVPQGEVPATPEAFIAALREIKDWYKFQDDMADPFSRTPAAERAIPALVELLSDPDKEVRTRAATTLGMIHRRPDLVVPALIELLEDGETNVQWHAVYALQQFGPEAKAALPALWKAAESKTPPVAIQCTEALKAIDPAADVEAHLITFVDHENADYRMRAILALRTHGAAGAKQALVAAFERETDPSFKDNLAVSIATIDQRLEQQAAADRLRE